MQSTQITMHNIRRSPALSRRIRELAERLENRHAEIIHCRIAVTQETASSRKGRAHTVLVQVRIPGRDLVAREQGEDVYVVLGVAFNAMRRELTDAAQATRAARHPRSASLTESPS